jgi:hypothetical protein
MSFDNRLIAARCIGGAWSLGEAHLQNERLWNGSCWREAVVEVWMLEPVSSRWLDLARLSLLACQNDNFREF